ncbi:amino acid ABC transporter substrate-binding protein [Paracoccus sp. MBLB3053]|uniref:Amino acid ABC transporter substrate-binding protein n=1 Tax=Paracoccus aurantius TaxID=3073814 RepID=A0ABU2HX07_9RHOB|nr:amino acid ABC transporter substrate-binding protein [Paracoccus sp. MBLB3053]MDS9469589.1 amino acid ABC transporter substrate-binding protein [Paracoccus sp. MBLB3053]
MIGFTRRAAIGLFCTTAAVTLSLGAAQAQEVVRIGYVASKSGPAAAGAGITTIPNYELWVHDVNAAGGLKLPDGSQHKIELIAYDDRSTAEEAVRAVERLVSQDKVDFILPPWGTGFNLAIAPLMDRLGYPHLAVTSLTDKAPEFAARWTKSFWMLGGGHDYAGGLADLLDKAVADGTINNKVAVISVSDGFGIDLISAARPIFAEHKLDLVYDKAYPVGTTDFAAIIEDVKASGADSFVAFSYPPETFALAKQSQTAAFNPKVFFTGVGTPFPNYPGVVEGKQEGVMSVGGVDGTSDKITAYFKRHAEVIGTPPDSWASAITYASLEMLQQSIERVGLDREAVAGELSSGKFDTVIGEVKLQDNQLRDLWLVGQWQGDTFKGVSPADKHGATAPIIPKPNW